ncbi:winged helix-turn-helix domain-containing protein [Echinimonas agarilytica]|uniref:Winged helix-turn-helix domain-containing protein n=1 Tax=Echinimonas agarilytica TaxID=1215918 RepID=A0AA41W6X2_9GAMM|nr:winged helix-turn-helix domain-containing protein [Echinimonas agarilytica]MCM2679894.1 winged helix-turn-helix domain-containing protein [Echinimonas agarilytica]
MMTPENESLTGPFHLNDFLVIPGNDQIVYDNKTHKLEPKAMAVLVYVVKHKHRIVSMQELLDTVWEGTVVTPQTVQRCISMLRKIFKLAHDQQPYIQTFSKKGYQLGVEPEYVDTDSNLHSGRAKHNNKTIWLGGLMCLAIVFGVIVNSLLYNEQPVRIFEDDSQIFAFTIHPSKDYAAYISRNEDNQEMEVWIRSFDGVGFAVAKLGKILSDPQVSWSADGSQLVVLREGKSDKIEAFSVDLAQRTASSVWHFEDAQHSYQNVALYDNETLYFTRTIRDEMNYGLYQKDIVSGDITQVETDGNVMYFDLSQGLLAYSASNQFQHNIQVKRIADGHTLVEVPHNQKVYEFDILSENGKTLLRTIDKKLFLLTPDEELTELRLPKNDISDMEMRNGQFYYVEKNRSSSIEVRPIHKCCQEEIAPSEHQQYEPTWNVDGSKVAFVSERSGLPQVWISEDEELTQLSRFASNEKLQKIFWSSDSQWILFLAGKDIYACSVLVKSCEPFVERHLFVSPMGFSQDSQEFYYLDENGFSLKIWKKSFSSDNKSMVEVTDESQVVVLNDEIYYQPRNTTHLYQYSESGAKLLTDKFPKNNKFLLAKENQIFYNVLERHKRQNVWSYNVMTNTHTLLVKRRSYSGRFVDYDGAERILLETRKDLNRPMFSVSQDYLFNAMD